MRILFIGDLNNQISDSIKIVSEKGGKISLVDNNHSALEYLRNARGADLILAPVSSSIKELYDNLQKEHINSPIISYGIGHEREKAVQSILDGAIEYLSFPPTKEIIVAVLQSISRSKEKLIGKSSSLKKLSEVCQKVAKSNATILVTGKSGTGKEVVSQYIHSLSDRKDQVFVSVNCAAIPENLMESELFGHEKGAFTGAIARRIGKFEESNNGTLLLDEISEMDVKLQAKLLRVLQEREIVRIGGNQKISLNLRVIATTNRNLEDYIKAGSFREDLFFRLNVINIKMPELSERREDIRDLSKYFMEKYCGFNNMVPKNFSKKSWEMLENYHWPGNIRELENVIYRAILLSKSEIIEPEDFMLEKSADLHNLESKNLIISTLNYCEGNRIHAANILGISVEILKKKLDEYLE